jgi:hypothetical protein
LIEHQHSEVRTCSKKIHQNLVRIRS